MNSALYTGRVHHARHAPRPHRFSYRLFLLYLDLDELDRVFRGRWLWSVERPNVASFRRRDFLGDPEVPLADAVRARVREELGRAPAGPVRLLTHVAFLGTCFNPVSFYYLFEEDGETLGSVVAEITNTPWGERHAYVLDPRISRRRRGEYEWTFDKAFHVSPFLDMDQRYLWRLGTPGDALAVHMENHEGGQRVFEAGLRLERRPLTGRTLAAALARHPWMTAKVHLAIYFQALLLWAKRTPFFAHPRTRAPRADSQR